MTTSRAARYAIGIDLGTTQSVVAWAPLADGAEAPTVELLPLPQILGPSTVGEQSALPSFLYLATAEEAARGSFDLPWSQGLDYAVGEWARRRSAEVPTRTVSAAKSWLCHHRTDRRQPILPWQAPAGVEQISPVEASRRALEHLRSAWDAAHPEAPLAEQLVVLTVPASFDASARELTREAALAAGLPAELVLLEEPQAAVYAWLAERGEAWRDELAEGDRLLVCDVGGGTSDFTLIAVESEGGELVLRRLAVGEHLLVGGDNMDLAIAHLAQGAFAERGVDVDAWQSVALWHSCRAAKERLLAADADAPATHGVSVLGRGSRLVGGAITVELERRRVLELLLDGFFPHCELGDRPARQRGSGFLEVGLPFEADAAITRHLAWFLSRQGEAGDGLAPTRVLYNGGVLKAERFQQRLLSVLASWFGKDSAPRPLAGERDLDSAVARGAAFYGLAKEGRGVRIRGGTARSYYVGIETAGLAIPGAPRPLRALCVVPRGMEEGTEIDVPSGEIGLVVGEPARFRFFSSTVREDDRAGDVLDRVVPEELAESDSLEATLTAADDEDGGRVVPVRFRSRITELGTFELWCDAAEGDERWKMEWSVRQG